MTPVMRVALQIGLSNVSNSINVSSCVFEISRFVPECRAPNVFCQNFPPVERN